MQENTQHISETCLEGASVSSENHNRPVIYIAHASVGSGHRSAALAIEQAFRLMEEEGDNLLANVDVEVIDILDYGLMKYDGNATARAFTGPTRKFFDIAWRYNLTGRLLWGGGTAWSRFVTPKFIDKVKQRPPLAIITTHITAANAAVGARMITKSTFPIVNVPTDYETEGFWPHKYTDVFCVASDSMVETLRARKIPEENILLSGIPASPTFSQDYDIEEMKRHFNLPEDKINVLVMAGASLPQPYVNFRKTLKRVLPLLGRYHNMNFVFLTGNDCEYASELEKTFEQYRIENTQVFSYVDQMAGLMAACDVAICKSGGLIVTECICARLPMILLGTPYAQEYPNTTLLNDLNIGRRAVTSDDLIETLNRVSENPDLLDAMEENGKILRRPRAARDIAECTLRLMDEPRERSHRHFIHLYIGHRPAHHR